MRRTVLLLVALLVATACGKKSGDSGKPKIAVSIFPLYDVTRRIAGDRFDVILVLPPGQSEHGFDPAPKDIARLEGAKLGIAVGLDMDTWVEDVMKTAGGVPRMLRVGERVKTIPIDVEPIDEGEPPAEEGAAAEEHGELEDHEDHADHAHVVGAPDPHVWMDPQRMIAITDAIAGELAVLDPGGKGVFEGNATAVKDSLATLDAELVTRSKAWTKRTIVTFHGSMSYFAARYGLRIAAVVEPIAGKEPTATYLAEVIEAIKRNKAAALFIEPQLDRSAGETIAREAGVPLGELDPIGGMPGRDSYEALLRWNADQLDKVLK